MIAIRLADRVLRAGGVVGGHVSLAPTGDEASRRVELSVLWETEGKGDTDIGVVHFAVLANGDAAAAQAEHAFSVQLPLMPLTYRGTLLTVRWLVRAKRLSTFGLDQVYEEEFSVEPIG